MANIFDFLKKTSDNFFDGLKSNAANKMIQRAKENSTPCPVMEKQKELEKEQEEMD